MLSERRQKQKNKKETKNIYIVQFHPQEMFRIDTSVETKNRFVVSGAREGECGVTANW